MDNPTHVKKKYYKSKVDFSYRVPDLPGEQWKKVVGDAGQYYQVSNLGRLKRNVTSLVKSDGRHYNAPERLLKVYFSTVKGREYGHVNLTYEGKVHQSTIHRLVAEAWIPNPENKQEVNHIDGNKNNNVVENLEWATRAENMMHAATKGLLRPAVGIEHFKSRAVVMYDIKTRAKLATFESANIAAVLLGKDSSHILEVCKGKREYAYGYYWEYRKEKTVTTIESSEERVE